MQYTPHDLIRATFRPKRTDNLRPGVAELVGQRFEFSGGWVVEDGWDYAGQIAWLPRAQAALDASMGWAPTEDLEDIELLSRMRLEQRDDEVVMDIWKKKNGLLSHIAVSGSISTDEDGKTVWHDQSGRGNDLRSLPGHAPSVTFVPEGELVVGRQGGRDVDWSSFVSMNPPQAVSREEAKKIVEDLRKLGFEEPQFVSSPDGGWSFVWNRQCSDQEMKVIEWYIRRRFELPKAEPIRMLSEAEMKRIRDRVGPIELCNGCVLASDFMEAWSRARHAGPLRPSLVHGAGRKTPTRAEA